MTQPGICPRSGEYCQWRTVAQTCRDVWGQTEGNIQDIAGSRWTKWASFINRFMPGLFHSPQQAEELLVATRNRIVDYDEILLLNCATDESCIVYEAMETRKLIDPILHPQDQVMDMEKFKAKD